MSENIFSRLAIGGTCTFWMPGFYDDQTADGRLMRNMLVRSLLHEKEILAYGWPLSEREIVSFVHGFNTSCFVIVERTTQTWMTHYTESGYTWGERTRTLAALCIGALRVVSDGFMVDAWDDVGASWQTFPFADIAQVSLVGDKYERFLSPTAFNFITHPLAANAYHALGKGGDA